MKGGHSLSEAPGLEDPDIASLLSEEEPENLADIVKSALNSKAAVGRVLRSSSTDRPHLPHLFTSASLH